MKHYFLALPKNNTGIDLEQNVRISHALQNLTRAALTPFYQYLQSALKTIEEKEAIRAKWKKVQENLLELKMQGYLYKVFNETTLQIANAPDWYWVEGIEDASFEEPVVYRLPDKTKKEIAISPNDLKTYLGRKLLKLPNINHTEITKIIWDMNNLSISPAWLDMENVTELTINEKAYSVKQIDVKSITIQGVPNDFTTVKCQGVELQAHVLSSSKATMAGAKKIDSREEYDIVWAEVKQQNIKEISHQEWRTFFHIPDDFQNTDVWEKKDNNNIWTFCYQKDDESFKKELNKTIHINNVPFITQRPAQNNQENYWIQLQEIEEDSNDEEDTPSFSPLHYFFEDEVDVEDDKGNVYAIQQGVQDDFKLLLKLKKHPYHSTYPQGDLLRVKINTYQLRKQLEAVRRLQNTPIGEHVNLIRLFERYDKVRWDDFAPFQLNEQDWFVITDASRSGANKQREFVQKALATPDFAIMEGPPGSGKTTVILELICQLTKQGKRVLLCGSTHVAIDNVLEKLNEYRQNGTLIEQLGILPLRIGDENRIGENVKQFQLHRFMADNNIEEAQMELLLDAANLVCGTTIGILQHPQFKNNKYEKKPIVPDFDYLIIDESSKTTFQEFLVPALFAKHWILVGDVMQLAPFTDRSQLVSALSHLVLKDGEPFEPWKQEALFYLHKIVEITTHRDNQLPYLAMVVSEDHLLVFEKELEHRKTGLVYRIIRQEDSLDNALEWLAYQVIFIQREIADKTLKVLPEVFMVLHWKDWKQHAQAFRHNYLIKKGLEYKLLQKREPIKNPFEIVAEINDHLEKRNWAEEIAWRMDREHQLHLKNNKGAFYTKAIDDLLPQAASNANDVKNRVNTIANIALPSILECLINGIKGRRADMETTMSQGLQGYLKDCRYTLLEYQHRMHSQISAFPRKQFYQNNQRVALQDLKKPYPIDDLRQWNYVQYPQRNVWIDIKGNAQRSCNYAEVDAMITEIKKFLDFALKNPQPEGKPYWTVACLTFYRKQERKLREKLQTLCKMPNAVSQFRYGGHQIEIKLHTVDKFQGQESDIVFLSMVQTQRDGFLDNPNRLNVAVTRAKFQLVVLGDWDYFDRKTKSDDLRELARHCYKISR